jgi:hypothetical protein
MLHVPPIPRGLIGGDDFAELAALADTASALVLPSLQFDPPSLFGRPVFVSADLLTPAANAKSLVFGDFKLGYGIRRVRGMRLIRQDELHSGVLRVQRRPTGGAGGAIGGRAKCEGRRSGVHLTERPWTRSLGASARQARGRLTMPVTWGEGLPPTTRSSIAGSSRCSAAARSSSVRRTRTSNRLSLRTTRTDVGNTEIPNYEPPDKGWGIVIGPFMRKPEAESAPPETQPTHDEDES